MLINPQHNDSSHDRPWSAATRKVSRAAWPILRDLSLSWEQSIMKAISVTVSAAAIAGVVGVVASGRMVLFAADSELKAEAVTDTNGNLHVPNAYRTTYEFLGT